MQRMFAMPFADLYPLYVTKVLKKNRTETELRSVISWLTGYDDNGIDRCISSSLSLSEFFANAQLNPDVALITGSVCGVKVQEVQDPLMRSIRYMDKLVDELAQGKSLAKIMRTLR
ncbi:hypothetical protein AINA4_06610 [Aurantimicrobium sp. INA4]|nr:DUF2200 domain-containing protein [Aurantimicrobium sp. INA4]BDU10740.1 hypothetical protein AINA4_06610 [Aurantimicrobium sp. INA4]